MQDKIKRARAAGYSRKDLAQSFGVSVSAIGRAERGETSGASIEAQATQFYKLGKKAKASVASGRASLPSAKLPRPSRVKEIVAEIVSPLRRAEGKISTLDKDAQVVVQVTMKGTGKSRTLYAHGGVWVGQIKYDLESSIASQYGIQYNDDEFDWADVVDIDVQEY